jgi:hypothetical protein
MRYARKPNIGWTQPLFGVPFGRIEPRFVSFEGADPVAFVVSKNLARRHLNTSQRAIIGARLATMRQGERTDLARPATLPKVDQASAADIMKVSERSLRCAVVVLESGTLELRQAVEQGEISVSRAEEIAKISPFEQIEAVRTHRKTRNRRTAEVIAAEKKSKAERRAAKMAFNIELDRARAEDEDLIRDIASIIFEAPEEKRNLVIEKIDGVGLCVPITDLALVMRDIRPELFLWEDASGAEDAA